MSAPGERTAGGTAAGVGDGHHDPAAGSVPAATVALVVVAGLLTVSCFLAPLGLVPFVLAVVAATRSTRDPAGADRLTRAGWELLAALAVLAVVLFVAAVVVVS